MSSPNEHSIASSPVSIRGSSPVKRRGSLSPTVSEERIRRSPTLGRSYDINDPEGRERQRTMDVDMAMHLSRARRETISTSPTVSPYDQTDHPEDAYHPHAISMLSPQEEAEIGMARGDVLRISESELELGMSDHASNATAKRQGSFTDLRLGNARQDQDPALLVSSTGEAPPPPAFGLPMYQANAASYSRFDFSGLENFAEVEKTQLGISKPSTTFAIPPDNEEPRAGPSFTIPSPRSRQRKLSQNNANPRTKKGAGKKLALFEGNAAASAITGRLGMHFGGSSSEDLPTAAASGTNYGATATNTGHDRPYRFSFYSNALSATIHARSLSELPAEGQTFEDLFTGLKSAHSNHPPHPTSLFPRLPPSRSSQGYFPEKGPQAEDSESATWWLDVQSPTDEEMKVLSKVFNIHPLTTEDIQMEEIREKIELFRNYYLVCFRSFDQDPYSPTYLEPLNMYIIVFREGTLSFHFRPTPHPQNVRRRIKQLKDYISVTSDWISYALIDDITDAFGPLIQSIEYEVDSIDELVLILKEAEQSDMLRRIGTCRKKVMGLLRLMGNKADVVKGLAKRCNENWQVAPTSDIGLYLSDIQDHLITMTQNLNHYEKILSRSHSNYLAQISIEMTDANNQINDVLSKLTALGTVLIPMNLVTGLWGMNVHVPGESVDGLAWFASIVAFLAGFAIIGGYVTYRFMVR
ncbi:cora-domain-containing protein [Cylindrobasidium torrendii FP15055 ss-10]|uniref:Cora-domain-containing protein n=1 Tax=Cylindrobasidium torrendii FP15055 ss-10 TaxID=1314674 RepID=A0A0D7BW64_9AGAR|nr:cora-domain-containing protein [Cylindrobasidium torrendii FP15055 ss-10]